MMWLQPNWAFHPHACCPNATALFARVVSAPPPPPPPSPPRPDTHARAHTPHVTSARQGHAHGQQCDLSHHRARPASMLALLRSAQCHDRTMNDSSGGRVADCEPMANVPLSDLVDAYCAPPAFATSQRVFWLFTTGGGRPLTCGAAGWGWRWSSPSPVNQLPCNPARNLRKCLLLHPATPYYPSPRGKFHTRGNIWCFTVG